MSTVKPMDKTRFAELAARLRASKELQVSKAVQSNTVPISVSVPTILETTLAAANVVPTEVTNKYGEVITYNAKQQEFINRVAAGENVILIGPAGTGKTTAMKGAMQALIQAGHAGVLQNAAHKHLQDGTPGVVLCAFTRRATVNIRNNVSEDIKDNCITIHKLLEKSPIFYEVTDPLSGNTRTTMRFESLRNASNPFPPSLKVVGFEESTMIGVDLYKEVMAGVADKEAVQFIFLGDIQQLPPVFGPAILGFKLLELPVVELTEVYRQALESKIMVLLHRILSGKPIPAKEFPEWKTPKQLTITPWKKKISWESALSTCALFFVGNHHLPDAKEKIGGAFHSGHYNPEEDIILMPFNKSFGTIELNKHIANALARFREATTYEVIAGFNKHYFSVGDKILYDKEDATILDIYPNPTYASTAKPQKESPFLNYWGFNSTGKYEVADADTDMDFILLQAAQTTAEDRVHAASHIIKIRMNDSDTILSLNKAAEINAILHGYCMTVHKAQGSEWRKVFFLTHESNNQMIYRELLYTACSRAREELHIICEPDTFEKGIKTQRVKGETLAEKAEFFKGKIKEGYRIEDDDLDTTTAQLLEEDI